MPLCPVVFLLGRLPLNCVFEGTLSWDFTGGGGGGGFCSCWFSQNILASSFTHGFFDTSAGLLSIRCKTGCRFPVIGLVSSSLLVSSFLTSFTGFFFIKYVLILGWFSSSLPSSSIFFEFLVLVAGFGFPFPFNWLMVSHTTMGFGLGAGLLGFVLVLGGGGCCFKAGVVGRGVGWVGCWK